MKITVIKETIALTKDDTLVAKSGKTYTVEFLFDASWDGYTKTAHFQAGSVSESVLLTDDKCDIPAKCLETAGVYLKVKVEGVKGSDTTATPWGLTSRILYESEVDIPIPPSPSPTPEGEVGRLCEEFQEKLESEYSEDELKDKSLDEVIGDMDGLDNTETDAAVKAALDEVWGPEAETQTAP